jgi:VWFA-related protein
VRLDLRVVDEAGRPITDLRREELIIEEAGRALPLMLFQRVTEPAESYVDAAMRAVTAQVSSNDAFPRGHLYILIFDQEHITPGNEQRARMAAEQFIRTRVRPSDRVALFGIPGPGPELGFTADKTRAMQQLVSIRGGYQRTVATPFGTMGIYEAHRLAQGDEKLISDILERNRGQAGLDVINAEVGAGGRGGGGGEDPSITRKLLVENARVIVNQTDGASRQFLQRLADVITQFRDIEGRKTVVLFSEGFFQDNLSRELEAVAAAASQSYAVFYSFDLNARTPSITDADIAQTSLGAEVQARVAPLGTLASETDGMLVLDAAQRSGDALNRIADQAQDYYLVGFAPSEAARLNRGKYHRVSIKVSRPGAIVSARTGYALKSETANTDRRRSINTILGAPFVQQGLKVDYTTYVMKGADAGLQRVVLSLTADLPVAGKPGDKADVVFVARDVRDGRVVASGTDTIALPAKTKPGAAVGAGAWRVQFSVPPGQYMMRAVVREPGGLAGSADRRLDVRALEGPDVSVSDLVIGSAVSALPVRAQAYTADGLTGVIDTYARTAAQLEGLAVTLDLRREDGSASSIFTADLQPVIDDGRGQTRRASFLVPLSGIAPGDYVARATVRAGGEVVAERTRHVQVLEGAAPIEAPAAAVAVSPAEIVQGQLARKYITAISNRAANGPFATAAKRALDGQWELVEAELQRAGSGGGGGGAALQGPRSDLIPNALRGLARFVREDYAGAAAALDLAQAADPQNALTAFFLGWAREGARDSRAALTAWRRAAFLDPTNVSAHLALADGYMRLAQPALAAQALKAGLTALPSSPELQERLRQIEGKENSR